MGSRPSGCQSTWLSAEPFDVRNTNDIANAFARIAANRLDALSVGIDALTQANAKTIVSLAGEHKVLSAYRRGNLSMSAGCLSYGRATPICTIGRPA